ncbi:hypothetical protein BRADI_5g08853v3 [Brachypodium distachyon]|uniref:Photosystem II cytochrome b559 alpha subunit lumenal region domain-containing protein n=1 Tax=Brachypodium distachyon TaxID=15368 RepID=A0A0Q3E3N3_BRADI|nr:hypothetical protein BRADI_5g08853v3 [Brachypodium distachyon]
MESWADSGRAPRGLRRQLGKKTGGARRSVGASGRLGLGPVLQALWEAGEVRALGPRPVYHEVGGGDQRTGKGRNRRDWGTVDKVKWNRKRHKVSTGLAYDVFGSPRPNEYFTESRQGIPLITDRYDSLQQLDEFSRSF